MVILINAFVLAPVILPSYKVANKDVEVHVNVTDKAADMLFYAKRGKSISLVCSSSLPSVGRPKVTVKGQRIEMEVKNSDHGWRRLIDLSSGTGILDITDKVVGKAQQPRVGDATSMYRLLRHFDTAPIGYRSRHCAGVTNAKFGCAVAALSTSVGLDQIGDNLIVRPLTTSGSPSKYKLFVGDSDEFLPNADYVGKWLWYNSKSLVNPGLPQTMPFKFYTPIVLNFGQVGENEEESGEVGHKEEEGPWEVVKTPKDEIGWPKGRKTIDLDMAAMVAWGMKWWGTTLGQKEWAERGDHFMNLTLETAEEGDPFASRLFTTETKKAADVEAKTSESTMYWQYRWAKKWPQSEQAEEIRERMEKAQEEIARSTEDSVLQRLRIERYLAAAEPVGENDRPIRVQLPQSRSIEEWIALLNISVDRKSIAEAHTYANQVALAQNLAKTKSPNQFGMIGQTASESSRAGYALIRAGALLDRKDLMERGVASMKWALNTMFDPSLLANGILVPQTINPGSMADFDSQTGKFIGALPNSFENGEGLMMAVFALVADEFGGFYKSKSGWSVGIDGCAPGPLGSPMSLLSSNPIPYAGEHLVLVRGPASDHIVTPKIVPSISKIVVDKRAKGVFLAAIPGLLNQGAKPPSVSGRFTCSTSKWVGTAKPSLIGLECPWPKGVTSADFWFHGKIGGQTVSFGPVTLKKP